MPEEDQAEALAAWQLDREGCDHSDNHADCLDPDRPWYPQLSVDYAEMALSAASAFYDEKHKDRPYHDGSFSEWSAKRSAAYPFHYRDGVHIWVSKYDLTPEADWL